MSDQDDILIYFLDEFGNPTDVYIPSVEQIDHYRGILPDTILRFWRHCGWSGFKDGMFWMVDPARYKNILTRWIAATPYLVEAEELYVLARNAFGHLYVWHQRKGYCFTIDPNDHWLIPGPAQTLLCPEKLEQYGEIFFACFDVAEVDQEDRNGNPMFQQAFTKLGPLARDEMYAFVPPITAGGKMLLDNLQKANVEECLSELVELQPGEILGARGYAGVCCS